MKSTFLFFSLLLSLTMFSEHLPAQQLKTFATIPGRTPSTKYQCRVRVLGTAEWKDAFVLQTTSKPIPVVDTERNGYTKILQGWSASWIAFEFSGTSVEVEISKVGGAAITKAMVRPVGHATEAKIVNGKAYVTFDKPANINVDIDGQMEDKYTGMGYAGPPVHTISLFANPIYREPTIANPKVLKLNPGDNIPAGSSAWDTIYFQPGVHNIGAPYIIQSRKVLYIPGNAVVHGTIHPPDTWGNSATINWGVYGSGTLSGEDIAWDPTTKNNKPFTRQGAGVRLEGFVVADPAHHTFNLNSTNQEDPKFVNIYKNLKVLGWRVNGDGINAFANSTITDCFLRTQDDVFYYGGNNVKISNCVTWNDFNGSVVYVTKGANTLEESYFKDIKVIYHRASWHYWEGGRVISFRDREPGNKIRNVQIRNVLIEDPFSAFPPFFFKMRNPNNSNALFDYDNIIIENVVQKHPAVKGSGNGDNTFGRPRNTMLGLDQNRKFENITFKNCSYNSKWLTGFEAGDFLVNDFNNNIRFIVTFNVTLSVKDSKGGTVSGGGVFNFGENVTVTATPAAGYKFSGWTINNDTVSLNPRYTFTVNDNVEIKANFQLVLSTNQMTEMPFRIYPNPAKDALFIDFSNNKIRKIQLVDLSGKLVYTNNRASQKERIDLSELMSGLYFVRIHTTDNVYTSKVIIRPY